MGPSTCPPASLGCLSPQGRRGTPETFRQKWRRIGLLTAGIAHDFNNLLTVVLGNLESVQTPISAADPPCRARWENANRGARQAAKLTEKLLAFARRKPLEPQLLDVNRLVSGMSDLLQRTLGSRSQCDQTGRRPLER